MDSTNSNIEQYFEEVKGTYGISFEHFKRICLTPFNYVKHIMSLGVLKNIRLQYFGTFEVSPSRVKYSKKNLIDSYQRGTISEERFNKRIKVLNNYEN